MKNTGNNHQVVIDLDNDSINITTKGDTQMENPGMNDILKMKGEVQICLFDENGGIKHSEKISNLVVTTGKNWLASKLAAESVNEMTHIAVGTSATAPSAGDTSLIGTELGRVAMTSKIRSGNQVTMIATFPAGTATGTLNEAGIFDGTSGTVMLGRVVFSGPVVKGASDAFQVTWTVTMA